MVWMGSDHSLVGCGRCPIHGVGCGRCPSTGLGVDGHCPRPVHRIGVWTVPVHGVLAADGARPRGVGVWTGTVHGPSTGSGCGRCPSTVSLAADGARPRILGVWTGTVHRIGVWTVPVHGVQGCGRCPSAGCGGVHGPSTGPGVWTVPVHRVRVWTVPSTRSAVRTVPVHGLGGTVHGWWGADGSRVRGVDCALTGLCGRYPVHGLVMYGRPCRIFLATNASKI